METEFLQEMQTEFPPEMQTEFPNGIQTAPLDETRNVLFDVM